MNYAQWGINWEIPASVEFFGLKNEFEQKAGLRLNGSGSRFRTLKNFSVIARKYFGGNTIFDEEIFEGVKTHKILLRYGYINSLAQYLLRDRNISTQRVKRAHVFLDGEYWYTTNCMEKYDETYYSEHYGVNKDNLIICEDGQLEDEKYQEQYDELLEFIENEDMSSEKNYERLAQIVDIQSYIDFMCANIYLDNMDISDEKNAAIWRTVSNTGTGYSDGRWRWSIFDLDAMEWNDFSDFGVGSQAEKNTFKLTQKYVGDPIDELDIFKSLMRNDTFKRSFVNTFMDLMNENFKYENVLMKMEEYPYYESEYMDNPGLEYYTDFFRDRPAFMKKYIKEELELKGETCNITIALDNPVGGQIIINSVTPDISSGMWRGEYYTDYPIQITAVPCEGYEFEGWNIEGNEIYDVSAEIYLESGENTVYGRFVKK